MGSHCSLLNKLIREDQISENLPAKYTLALVHAKTKVRNELKTRFTLNRIMWIILISICNQYILIYMYTPFLYIKYWLSFSSVLYIADEEMEAYSVCKQNKLIKSNLLLTVLNLNIWTNVQEDRNTLRNIIRI